jgi:hypothetical protein
MKVYFGRLKAVPINQPDGKTLCPVHRSVISRLGEASVGTWPISGIGRQLYHGFEPTGRFAFRTLENTDFMTRLVRFDANEPHRLAAPQTRKNSDLGAAVQWVWLDR